jgi:hypothetical protein
MSNFEKNGKFAVGNKIAAMKKDHNKEIAQHIVGQELQFTSRLLCQMSHNEVKQLVESGEINNLSVAAYQLIKKTLKGDLKAFQWLTEMTVGKPKQQIEASTPQGKSFNFHVTSTDN